jgi:hypothetical protein
MDASSAQGFGDFFLSSAFSIMACQPRAGFAAFGLEAGFALRFFWVTGK